MAKKTRPSGSKVAVSKGGGTVMLPVAVKVPGVCARIAEAYALIRNGQIFIFVFPIPLAARRGDRQPDAP